MYDFAHFQLEPMAHAKVELTGSTRFVTLSPIYNAHIKSERKLNVRSIKYTSTAKKDAEPSL